MIDVHSHLLPGVDDGSKTIENSVRVLQRFAEQGVRVVVCTPHLDASRAASAPHAHHLELLAELRAHTPPQVNLELGWEIMLDSPGVDLSAPELSLGNSRAVLVEFTRGGLPPGASAELRRIVRSGRIPVLAHPERYFGCTLDMVREWRALGTVIQTDASVLMSKGVPGQFARSMLQHGLIDLLASDNHGDDRSLATAATWLTERGAHEQVELLTSANAQRVLQNEDPMPVPPLKTNPITGLFRRIFAR